MINNNWMDDPVLSDISEEKFNLLTNIMENSKDLDGKKALSYFVQESTKASKQGVSFSDEETNAILNVLKADMTPEEIKRVDMVKKLVTMMHKNKGLSR